jgi:aldehyde:ferredoxin oxidoreductase
MAEIYGWTKKILRVDLSKEKITTLDTMKYAPALIGGLGVSAMIAWEEIPPDVGPFDPDNRLMLMVGPLTGTLASGAGRVEVMGVAPQQHPPCFSRSGMGGHWGPELKYAGFDGVVVHGRSKKPVYIWINDGETEILDASHIWGTGTYGTTRTIKDTHGEKTRVVACGQAGENLSRIAIVQTETESAAAQGGFGAVMGSKNLKAIAVRGTKGVKIAKSTEFLNLCLNKSREGSRPFSPGSNQRWPSEQILHGTNFRRHKCGFCSTICTNTIYTNIPGIEVPSLYTTEQMCYGYKTRPFNAQIEARVITSNYGINGWEVSYGIIPWLQLCKQHGLIDNIDGMEIPVPKKPIEYLRDCATVPPKFLRMLLRYIAFRESPIGDALSDGACYAADKLFSGKGKPLLDRIYPRHGGQTEHWGGHWGPGGTVYWPWWLPPVLQWCMDTRDPASDSTHQWTEHVQPYLSESGPNRGPYPIEKVRAVSKKVYGDPRVCDPAFEYDPPETKALPAVWHTDRAMIVDSLILCDRENTRVFSMLTEDGSADTALMSKLFSTCTGIETSEGELQKAGERIFNLLRAIDIRNYGRNRKIDEEVIDVGFHYPGKDDGIILNKEKFLKLMDKYYELRGWNKTNGWPTRVKLEELGLKEIADHLEEIGRLG